MKINQPAKTLAPQFSGNIQINLTIAPPKEEEPKDKVEEGEEQKSELQKQIEQLQLQMAELKKTNETHELELKKLDATTVKSQKISILLNSKEYTNISKEEGFKMLGYFTENSHKEGYPWRLKKPGGLGKQGKAISLMEAASRLSRGEEVIMQPMRVMNLDLSPTALATVASVVNPATAAVAAASELTKQPELFRKPVGHEARFGAPVRIDNFGELKLLTELYDSKATGVEGNKVSDAARTLGKFTQTVTSNYPWKILKDESDGKAWRVIKATTSKAFKWAIVGAGVGAIIGGIGGMVADKLASFALFGLSGMAATAVVAGTGSAIAGGVTGARETLKGEEISSFEALSRIVDEKPIILQKQKIHSVGVPILGTHNYFTDYGEPNIITGHDELKMFSNILEERPEEKKEEKK